MDALTGIGWQYLLILIYQAAVPAIKKYHKLGGLNNKNIFSSSSGDTQSHVEVPPGSVSGEDSSWLAGGGCTLMCLPLCTRADREISLVCLSLLVRTPVLLDEGLAFILHSTLVTS